MAYVDTIKPFCESILLAIPAGIQSEARDALLDRFNWEEYRLAQDPVLEDTGANQLEFVKDILANHIFGFLVQNTTDVREETLPADILADVISEFNA